MPTPPVTLLTDFGKEGPYPGAMKGVLASRTDAPIVDLTHQVPRHDIRHGAFVLWSVAPRFPEGTVHCCVVDPGVGTERGAVAIRSGGQLFVGPDNGLMVPAARKLSDEVEVRRIEVDAGDVSATFHGRDVFAPTAADLSADENFEDVGPVVEPKKLELFVHRKTEGGIETEIAFVDPFGNVVTGVPGGAAEAGDSVIVEVADEAREARRVETYGEAAGDDLLLLEGSTGLLELGVNRGSAAAELGVEPGDTVVLKKKG